MEGRAFTIRELKSTIIAASGGFTTGLFCQWKEMEVWEVLEAIEMVVELQDRDNP